MKEVYTKPQAEVETFATVDVITTSGGDVNTGGSDLPPIFD